MTKHINVHTNLNFFEEKKDLVYTHQNKFDSKKIKKKCKRKNIPKCWKYWILSLFILDGIG